MAEQTTTAKPTTEQSKNCGGCGKPVKKIKRYYRNNKYFCNRGCFKKAKAKADKKESA